MKIYFKWPNNDKGKQFYINTNSFTGVKDVQVDEIAATKIDNGIYQFYDAEQKKERQIQVINQLLDNPKVEIDGKDIELFIPTTGPVKVMIMLPLLSFLASGGVMSVLIGLICAFVNIQLNHKLKNNVIKTIVFVVITLLCVIFTRWLAQFGVDQGWWKDGAVIIGGSSSSSQA